MAYIQPTENQKDLLDGVELRFDTLQKYLTSIPESQRKSVALTHLETAQMFINKAIILDS